LTGRDAPPYYVSPAKILFWVGRRLDRLHEQLLPAPRVL